MLRERLNALLNKKKNLKVEVMQVREQGKRNKIERELEELEKDIIVEKQNVLSRK